MVTSAPKVWNIRLLPCINFYSSLSMKVLAFLLCCFYSQLVIIFSSRIICCFYCVVYNNNPERLMPVHVSISILPISWCKEDSQEPMYWKLILQSKKQNCFFHSSCCGELAANSPPLAIDHRKNNNSLKIYIIGVKNIHKQI